MPELSLAARPSFAREIRGQGQSTAKEGLAKLAMDCVSFDVVLPGRGVITFTCLKCQYCPCCDNAITYLIAPPSNIPQAVNLVAQDSGQLDS